jgi:hypothetical protein
MSRQTDVAARIVEAARRLTNDDERNAHVKRACGADAALYKEVMARLAEPTAANTSDVETVASGQATDFNETTPSTAAPRSVAGGERPGEIIDRYRLIRERAASRKSAPACTRSSTKRRGPRNGVPSRRKRRQRRNSQPAARQIINQPRLRTCAPMTMMEVPGRRVLITSRGT